MAPGRTLMLKAPSMLVMVAFVTFPFSATVTPIRGSPFSSTTDPETACVVRAEEVACGTGSGSCAAESGGAVMTAAVSTSASFEVKLCFFMWRIGYVVLLV